MFIIPNSILYSHITHNIDNNPLIKCLLNFHTVFPIVIEEDMLKKSEKFGKRTDQNVIT